MTPCENCLGLGQWCAGPWDDEQANNCGVCGGSGEAGSEPVHAHSWWTSIADLHIACQPGSPLTVDSQQPADLPSGVSLLEDGQLFTEHMNLVTCADCLRVLAEVDMKITGPGGPR